ncbi:MAG: hypothetical protein J2P24_02675 [Streptosporangiales bacterium]|nr:hypothetical protein [Streptosporangiales bacterium]MBO0891560.1 hypothetical protein [Acidothermales bacterium]
MDTTELRQASERAERAIRSLTDALEAEVGAEEATARNWEVLRSLAGYQDAATRPEYPTVLEWVPPLLEVEEGDRSRDKVVHFATWVFSVADEARAVAAARSRLAGDPDGADFVEHASDAVAVLFDEDVRWGEEYEQLGLDLELVTHSSHTMFADEPQVAGDIDARITGGRDDQ